MKPIRTLHAALGCLLLLTTALHAQVPNVINYQGRVAVGTPAVNFNSPPNGQFKFALVNAAGTTTYWSNDNTSAAGSQPTAAVSLAVTKGLYSVLLGDTTVVGMPTAIPASAWTNADVRLRVWFNDGTTGFQLLSPDQRLAPNGYLPDGSVSSTALASNAVTSTKIASGAVTNTQLAANAVQTANIANGAVDSTKIANVSIATTNLANSSVTAAKLGADVGLWSVNGADIFRSAGNVGIGTGSPGQKLDIAGNVQLNGTHLIFNSANGVIDWGSTGTLLFRTNNGNGNIASYAERMRIDPNGNVGIGPNPPAAKLSVTGSGFAAPNASGTVQSAGHVVRLADSSGSTAVLDIGQNGASGFWLQSTDSNTLAANYPLQLNPNGGNVGIGTTTPNATLSLGAGTGAKLAIYDDNVRSPATIGHQIVMYQHYEGVFPPVLRYYSQQDMVFTLGNPAPLAADGNDASFRFKDAGGVNRMTITNGAVFVQGNLIISGQMNCTTMYCTNEITCVAINLTSDRNAKEEFKPVNARAVLDKVARLPISEWQYKGRDKEPSDGTRHIGPMAQDFHEAFALGRDDKHITSVDADGVALAAIQGLNEKLEEKDAELSRLKTENQSLAERLAAIERALGLGGETTLPKR